MHAMVLTSVEMSLIAVMISIPLWQVGDGGVLEEIRRKTEFSDYSISIVFWKSSFYSSSYRRPLCQPEIAV